MALSKCALSAEEVARLAGGEDPFTILPGDPPVPHRRPAAAHRSRTAGRPHDRRGSFPLATPELRDDVTAMTYLQRLSRRTLLSTFALAAIASSPSQEYASTYFDAQKHKRAGRMEAAMQGYQEALLGARAAGDRYWGFFAAYSLGYAHRNAGNLPAAVRHLDESLDLGLDAATGDVIARLRDDRRDAFVTGIHLTKLLASQGRLASASRAQLRINRLVDRWVEATTGSPFRLLTDVPPEGLDAILLASLWRARTSQASLWDIGGRTLEAVALLQSTLTEPPPQPARDSTWHEWQRTRLNLAVMTSFLGYWKEATAIYADIMNAGAPSTSTPYARLNWARLSSRLEGPSPRFLEEARRAVSEIDRLGDDRNAHRTLAAMESDLGEAERARTRLRELQDESSAFGDAMLQLYARRQLLLQSEPLKAFADRNSEAAYLDLLASYRQRAALRGLPTVYRGYARYLAGNDRLPEAIAMMRRAARMTDAFGWHLHLPRMWAEQAQWHQQLGQARAAEALWRRIDEWLSQHRDVDDQRRLEILLARVQWLATRGDRREGLAAYRRAEALVAASGLSPHQTAAFRALDPERLLEPDPPRGRPAEIPQADLQPLAVRCRMTPGEPAQLPIILSNPGAIEATGRFTLRGPIVDERWDPSTAQWRVTLDGSLRDHTVQSPEVTCAAGERILVLLDTGPGAHVPKPCILTWLPHGSASHEGNHRAEVEFTLTEPHGAGAAATASAALRNAFYAVPVPLVFRSDDITAARDYRLIASSPCWIEITDLDGNSIAVDAQGNGSFEDAGDLLAQDENANGFPDIAFDDSPADIRLLLFHVYPTAETHQQPVEIAIQLRQPPGHWETESISVVR